MAVRSKIDIGRMVAAVRRPGIDPRVNLSFGEVVDIGFDAEHGMFADVRLQPDMNKETCMLGSAFVTADGGEWNPPDIGAIVLVALPLGNPNMGPVAVCSVWTPQMLPPAEFGDQTTSEPTDATPDRVVVVKPGRKYRIVARKNSEVDVEVSGGGNLNLTAKDASNINITADANVKVNGSAVILGNGGSGVGTVGDMVAGVISVADLAAALKPGSTATGVPFVASIVTGIDNVEAG